MNPNDSMGVEADNLLGSQPEQQTPDEGLQVNSQGAENLSAEEATWNNLKGSTQDRIKQLAKQANEERRLREEEQRRREQIESQLRQTPYQQPTYNQPQLSPEVQAGVRKLEDLGLASKSYVESLVEEKSNQKLSGLVYNITLDRLEQKHSGVDGLPAFSKDEYEAFIGRYPQYRSYDPEDVYDKMYKDEILEAQLVGRGARPNLTQATPVLRPGRTRVQEETMDAQTLMQKMESMPQAERIAYYERNQDKINAIVAKSTLEASQNE